MKKNTLISFSASWCKPCQNMKQTIDNLEHLGYNVERYDIDEHQELRDEYGVSSVPTFIIVNTNDEEKYRLIGATTLVKLTQLMEDE